ncbi:receptor-like protein kinase FERONIA [Rosa rugosa]|uniref:receptor-like protein kinase FERONIA n=1 Tax=Rosa rugosa TaxID=74645 RepID=UPI002B40643F|nr:receptor-like protein kinase FERONIA [Rosa rugosa]
MKPIISPLYLYLFLHILTLFVTGQSPPYIPVENITLACGNSGQLTSNDNRKWSGDIDSKFTPIGNASESINAPRSHTGSRVPYSKARLSRSNFTYTIPLSPGQKFICLHFNPDTYTPHFQRPNSLFAVTAGGFTLLKDFNASFTADAFGESPLVREFCVNIETGRRLEITFTPSRDAYAFINGIEIVSMPTGLYNTSSANMVDANAGSFAIGNKTALEMVYRLNVGGGPIWPNADTGMYLTWETADDIYLDNVSKKLSVLQNDTIELNFVEVPEYSAPKPVYTTGRSMGWDVTTGNNLTWVFPLDPNFYYLVRLHFCGIRNRERWFQIYLANQTADVIRWSGGDGIPVYKDYVVGMFMPPVGSQKKVDLFLALSPLPIGYADSNAMLNGLEIFKLSDSSGNFAGPNPNPPQLQPTSQKLDDTENKKSSPMVAIVAGVVAVFITLSVLIFLVSRRRWKLKDSGSGSRQTMNPGQFMPTNLCRYFPLEEITAATKNFNDTFIIGAGGFGNVYKGCTDGGATPVAIKRLKPGSSQGAHEFKTEIEMLSQLRHRHLVSLIGYCVDKGEMILVYDYMAHGTLRDHLYHTDNPPLPWEKRLQICVGTARGLQYLHNGAKGTIINRDVKSTNILLDDKWVAKVSDFGLSKGTTNMSETHISTMVKGSFGYLDPEYYRRQRLTEKSDVYSLGVVLFEVLCARPAVIQTEELKQVSLAEWAKICHQNGDLDQIIDPSLRGKISADCLNKFTEVAISCMHDDGTERPSMNDVVKELELALLLQQSAEGNTKCTDRNVETETSSSDHSCATNDSVKCISATIFSEINNPSGR